MPSARRINDLLNQGKSYGEVAEMLAISPGLAHLIATGTPADVDAGQDLPHHNPTQRDEVGEWVRRRATAELQRPGGEQGRS